MEASSRDRFEVYPDLSYYYGFTPSEISRMERWLKVLYLEAIPRFRAQNLGDAIAAATFRHMKDEDRRSIQRTLNRALVAGVSDEAEEKPKTFGTPEEFKDAMAAIGIGVKEQ